MFLFAERHSAYDRYYKCDGQLGFRITSSCSREENKLPCWLAPRLFEIILFSFRRETDVTPSLSQASDLFWIYLLNRCLETCHILILLIQLQIWFCFIFLMIVPQGVHKHIIVYRFYLNQLCLSSQPTWFIFGPLIQCHNYRLPYDDCKKGLENVVAKIVDMRQT